MTTPPELDPGVSTAILNLQPGSGKAQELPPGIHAFPQLLLRHCVIMEAHGLIYLK